MFNRTFKLFKHFLTKKNQNSNVMMTGRWNLDYDDATQHRKVYWANMDHCGCCHLKKNDALNKKPEEYKKYKYSICKIEESEEYILPYVI